MSHLLLVVDYQVDFVSGSLGFPGAELLDAVICEKIQKARDNGDTVCFTLDTHSSDYLETQEGTHLPVPHCLKGSAGWQLYGKTAQARRPQDPVFEKPTFGSAALLDYLRTTPFDSVELCGLVSNICVLSNAIIAKTALPEATILVDAAATAAPDPVMHQKALDVLAGVQVQIISSAERKSL